jgi:NAD(P)-dependent dehydrogenase (short-subunit alcohol dehydrogenase family)
VTQLLENKNAIIYGVGGLGRGIARTFAREGARVFLAARRAEPLAVVAAEIRADGGSVETAVVDALDETAVDAHVQAVVAEAGGVDVSFNLVSRGDVQGVPFLDISAADLRRPVADGLTTNFVTARAAGRQMVQQGSGVILYLTSGSSQGAAPMMGGTGPADAAVETLMRYLAAEWGPQGVRVAGVWTAAVTGTLTKESIEAVGGEGAPSPEQVEQMIAGMAALRQAPRVAQVADTAAFLASDRASGITASTVNVTCGLLLP